MKKLLSLKMQYSNYPISLNSIQLSETGTASMPMIPFECTVSNFQISCPAVQLSATLATSTVTL